MSNSVPTLINGFEDIVTFIKQQEHRNQKLQEENKKLQERNESLCKRIHQYSESEKIKKMEELLEKERSISSQLEEKIENLQEENESLMKSEVRQVKVLKEEIDDLKGRLEDVNHIAEEWEDSYNELKQESEESYNELTQKSISQDKKIFIQDYIIKNMLYKLLCDNSDVCAFEIDKKWTLKRDESFNNEYSDIMKQVCKEMDEDDWNGCAGTDFHLTLGWKNDTVETILHEPEDLDK